MKTLVTILGTIFAGGALMLAQNAAPTPTPRALIDQYCVSCHNQRLNTAGLALDKVDPAHVEQNAEIWEKVVRKLRAGMMPPQGLPRPNPATYEALLTAALETQLDRAAAANPVASGGGPPDESHGICQRHQGTDWPGNRSRWVSSRR